MRQYRIPFQLNIITHEVEIFKKKWMLHKEGALSKYIGVYCFEVYFSIF